jgi:hypothetical protein
MKGSTRKEKFLQVKEAGQKGSSQLAKTDKDRLESGHSSSYFLVQLHLQQFISGFFRRLRIPERNDGSQFNR